MSAMSLPSFAQAFSSSSLSSISASSNSLPPIHNHTPHNEPLGKRSREDISDNDRSSPRVVRIKEEEDREPLDPSPPPKQQQQQPHQHEQQPDDAANHPSKKRRVTVSDTPHPLTVNTSSSSSEQTASTPISPVVMGLPFGDDPAAIEQVRNMLSVKQKQKALIEQRRGSAAGVVSYPPQQSTAIHVVNPVATRISRKSPNANTSASVSRRPPLPTAPICPSSPMVSSQQNPVSVPVNSLPPPPISFARRRASQFGSVRRKPADILISPRGMHPSDDGLAPVIQSAPPVSHGELGKFTMAIPRLPSINGAARRVAGQVPPTPTRIGMRVAGSSVPTGRSPPAPSIPISSTLVPPTPSSLHHPVYTNDKSAFLAPFELFYDALNDSKQLKNWLSEQLQKSNMLAQSLKQQQEKLDEIVEHLVESRTRAMREEMGALRGRVEALEEALRVRDGGWKHPQQQNGNHNQAPEPSTSYTFPSRLESIRRVGSPAWSERDRDREHTHHQRAASPPPDSRKVCASASAARLDQGRPSASPHMGHIKVKDGRRTYYPASENDGGGGKKSERAPGEEK